MYQLCTNVKHATVLEIGSRNRLKYILKSHFSKYSTYSSPWEHAGVYVFADRIKHAYLMRKS